MFILVTVVVMAFAAGFALPLKWGVWGFAGAVLALFLVQVGLNTARGFEGTSLEESLLLFNGSYVSYLGFNLQISYRAFAVPVLALAGPLIFRLSRKP